MVYFDRRTREYVRKRTQFLWKGNRVKTVCNNLIRISEIRTLSKTECKGGHKLLNKDDIAITTLLFAVNAKSSYHILMQYPTALKLRINECNLLRSIHKLRIIHLSDEIYYRRRTRWPSRNHGSATWPSMKQKLQSWLTTFFHLQQNFQESDWIRN